MNKTILSVVITLFLIGVVYAGSIALSNARSLSIDNSQKEVQEKQADTITFSCDGTPMSAEGLEPDGKYDLNDLTSLTSANCEGVATNIKVNNVDMYSYEGKIGTYEEVRSYECSTLSGSYDAGKDSCAEVSTGSEDYL
jgi:hypothetical protein